MAFYSLNKAKVSMKKIIIIDDDPGIQDSVSLIFNPAEYEITICPNGNKILAGEFELPDIFIIDKQLPGVDGLEICKHLKEQEATRNIPVILMSASPSISEFSQAAGAEEFIEKPYTLKQMRGLVAKHTS
jgi:CheY-like chemotaxis protein